MQRKYSAKLTLITILQQMVGNSKCWENQEKIGGFIAKGPKTSLLFIYYSKSGFILNQDHLY